MATAFARNPWPSAAGEPADGRSRDSQPDQEQSTGTARRVLIVLGMHRSGTSALTRVLSLCGAALPSHLLPAEHGLPNDGNTQAGFWESKPLMLLHEEALASAGSNWQDLCEVPPSWFNTEIAKTFTGRLVETLTAEYGDAPVFVAKDPRISRLAPIWDSAVRELGAEANWVISIRNPLEVAASLNRRDGFPQPKGLLLWLTYFLAAERHTRDQKRLFVLYDDLLRDWRGVVTRIENQFGLAFSRRSYAAAAEIDDFLDLALRHHETPASEVAVREDVAEWVKDAFQWASRAAAGHPEGGEPLDEIRRALEEAETVYGPLLATAEYDSQKRQEHESQMAREVEELKKAVGDYDRKIAELNNELTRARVELSAREETEQQQGEAARAQEELSQQLAQLSQLTGQQRTEISMLRDENKAAIARLDTEIGLSLKLVGEREDQLGAVIGKLENEVHSLREQLEESSTRPASAPASTVEPEPSSAGSASSRVKTLAFFLPQYHPIPENDAWWGRGFTEWTNVTKAKPCFRGHQQPFLPSELGFYDLRLPEVRSQQAALAREHGIHGFCYYYYWFEGRKLLQRPLEEMLASGEPDFPFCLCWANENWTRRWDGEDQAILMAQGHSPEEDAGFIDDVLPALLDPRYIKRNGEPILLVYRADLLTDSLATTAHWREAARRAGLPGLHLCAVYRVDDPLVIGFDALVEFPPHHFPHTRITDQVEGRVDGFKGEVFDFAAGVEAIEPLKDRSFPVYRGVMTAWDNTPRRGTEARIFAGSTPECFGEWLEKVVRESGERPGDEDQFVFINAWNEWAEGAVLEPSRLHGRGYLEATRSALLAAADPQAGLSRLEQRIHGRLETLGNAVAELSQSADQRQSRLDAVLTEHQSGLDGLRDTATGLEATVEEHRATLEGQQSDLNGLRDTAANVETRLEEHQSGLRDTRARLETATEGLGELRGVATAFEKRLEGHQTILEVHESGLDWLRGMATRLEGHQTTHESQQSALHWLRETVESGREDLTEQIHELKTRVDGLRLQARNRQAGSSFRDLWLSLSHGVLGLVLKLPIWLLGGRLPRRLSWWRQGRRVLRSGLFDADYYRERYPEIDGSGIDPLYHYVRYGAAEGRDPNPFFSGRRYLRLHPEVIAAGDNPLLHYLAHGDRKLADDDVAARSGGEATAPGGEAAVDGTPEPSAPSAPAPGAEPVTEPVAPPPPTGSRTMPWTLNQDQLAKREASTTTLLFVSHDAARAGSQIYLLEVIKSLSRLPQYEIYLLMRSGGELRADFERYAHVLDIQEQIASGGSEESAVVEAVRAAGNPPGVALCNTVASGAVAKILAGLGLPVVSIVHELPTTIESLGQQTIRDTVGSSETVIVVSEFVKNALVERYDVPPEQLTLFYVGATGWNPEAEPGKDSARRRVFEKHGLPDDAVLVLGCGSIHHRKGTDLFVQVARDAVLDHGLDRTYFLWVGGDELGPLLRSWCEHDIATFGLQDRVIFAGQQASTVDYYLAADVFLLTSREDPFPLVNLEALARGLPIVAFADAGGAQEALVDDAGVVVPYLDTAEMTRALVRLVEAPRYRAAISERALSRAHERYRWDRFIGELRELLEGHVARSKPPAGTSIT